MQITRRGIIRFGGAGLGALALGLPGAPAWALSADEATAHVRKAVDDVLALIQAPGDGPSKAEAFRGILERHAAMPQIAKFAAGVTWREMSEAQQAAYSDGFAHYLALTYARRFQEYSGQTVTLGDVVDAGKKGILVKSEVTQSGGTPIVVDWLVSDRPGRTVIADIVIEGVSLLVTQREEIAAMLEKRGGNLDQLIADLKSA